MSRRGLLYVCVLTMGLGVQGCGGDGDGDDTPTIAKEWPAPGDACGNLGNDCSSCSGSTEICYSTDPEICIPRGEAALMLRCSPGTCMGDTPYCIAEQCLTLEQATCMCAGAVGSMLLECEKGPEFAAGM